MHVYAVKAKVRNALVGKWYNLNFAGILCDTCLGMFIIYIYTHSGLSLHVVFDGSFGPPLHLLISVALGVLLLLWSNICVLLMRKSIEQSHVKDIEGLTMSPTMTTSMRSKN